MDAKIFKVGPAVCVRESDAPGRARLASRSRLLAGWGSWGRSMHRSLRGRRRVLGAVESGATGGSATWTAPRKRAPGAGAVAGGWVGDDTVTERGVPSTGRAELQGRREYSLPFPSLLFAGFVSSPYIRGRACLNFGSPFGGRCDFICGWPAQGPRDSWKKRMAEKWVWIKSGGGGYGWIGLCSSLDGPNLLCRRTGHQRHNNAATPTPYGNRKRERGVGAMD